MTLSFVVDLKHRKTKALFFILEKNNVKKKINSIIPIFAALALMAKEKVLLP